MSPVSKYALYLWVFSFGLLACSGITWADQGDADIPLPVRMAIHKAQQLMEKERFREAAAVLNRFAEQGKELDAKEKASKGHDHYLVHFILGNCCLMTQDPAAAASHYGAALERKPDFHPGWMNLARCRCDMNAHAKAGDAFLKGYETALKKDPETLYYGAICFITAKDIKKALATFQRLLNEHPHADIKLEWKEALVQIFLDSDQTQKALPFIEELSEKVEGKKRQQWQELRLHTYLSLGMKAKALPYVKRLVLEYPAEPKWWKGLSHFYLKENQYKPALVALTVKGFLEPLTAQEERIVADLNMTLDVPAQAVRMYERLAGQEPGSEMAYRIAQGYFRLHRPEKALEWVEKALLQKEGNGRSLLLKGDLLYELERYPEAVRVFEKAAHQREHAGRAWLMAGYAAWNAKDLQGARRAFENAAGHPKQKKAALRAMQQLEQERASREKGGDLSKDG